MKIFGSILLTALTTLGACSDAETTGPNGERADDIDPLTLPELAEQYGAVVSTNMNLCRTQTSPCSEDDRLKVTATMGGILKLNQDGVGVRGDMTVCGVQLTLNDEPYDSSDYLNLAKLGSVLKFDAAFESTESGLIIRSDMAALVVGADLSDDVGEDFPTSEDDARVHKDSDGDPGVTVKAPIGRVFLGARLVIDLDLAVAEDGTMLGAVRGHDYDVSIFGDTIWGFNIKKKVKNILDPLTLIDQDHSIELTPNTADCAAAAKL